jgi:hypothetical protein
MSWFCEALGQPTIGSVLKPSRLALEVGPMASSELD